MPKPPDYKREIAWCNREIQRATVAVRTGVSPDTGLPISAHEAALWHADVTTERRLVREEMVIARQIGMSI